MKSSESELKAVILAAGQETIGPAGRPLVIETLGERAILDTVVENALQLVAPENLYVVVSAENGDVQAHLGDRFRLCSGNATGYRRRGAAGASPSA